MKEEPKNNVIADVLDEYERNLTPFKRFKWKIGFYFYYYISSRFETFAYWVKHKTQKLTRGYSDEDLYCAYGTFSEFILPRLKLYKEDSFKAHPNDEGWTIEKWDGCLDKMIRAFELSIEHTKVEKTEFPKKKKEQMQEGLELFSKYYTELWY